MSVGEPERGQAEAQDRPPVRQAVGFASPADLPDEARALRARARRHETGRQGRVTVWYEWGQRHRAGKPPVLLLHGGYGSWTHWLRTVPALAADRAVLVPDMPGFGESDNPPPGELLDSMTAALAAGLNELLGSAAFDLVGFSFGTVISGVLAAKLNRGGTDGAGSRPRVRRLVVVAPSGLGIPLSDFSGLARIQPGMSEAELREAHRSNLGRLMIADPAAIDELAVSLQAINVARARVFGRPFSRSDALVRALERLEAERVTAIWGTRDAYAARNLPAYEAALASVQRGLEVHRIEGAGHWVAYEFPEAFNRLLREVLDAGGGAQIRSDLPAQG